MNADYIELLPSTSVSGAGTAYGLAVSVSENLMYLAIQLDVSAAAEAAGDKLDVYLQTTIDGTNWTEVYRFTQIAGNGDVKRYYGKIAISTALTEYENGAALGEHTSREFFGKKIRVKYITTDVTAAAFTFSVYAGGTMS